MSEQEMNAADAEDTEGHVHWKSDDPMGPADSSFRRGDDDVEGHHMRHIRGDDGDDTEGHARRDDDDDVEGHRRW